MSQISDLKPIGERFEHVLGLLSSSRFLNMEGLGKEVPFYICQFNPKEQKEMTVVQRQLINKLSSKGISVLELNLYDLTIEILKEEEILENILENESEWEKDELKDLLQDSLDPETVLIPKIAKKMKESDFQILFISGVGEVFPYIRSHNILNNLQSTAKDRPTVMFFPGAYTHCKVDGSSLDLFGRLRDDRYYRAFNIDHCEI